MKTCIWINLRIILIVSILPCFTEASSNCSATCVNGNCINESCNCNENWYGNNCTEFVCEKTNPCFVGGKCVREGENDFRCVCPEGYGGTLCECNEGIQPIKLCPPDNALKCSEWGTCVIDPVSKNQTCSCQAGFGGADCETEIDHCLTRGCGVGECTNIYDPGRLGNWYSCTCPEGYDPDFECNPAKDLCYNQPCDHGNCSLPVPHDGMDYICTCDVGYTGKNCSTLITHCDNNPCLHGGVCADLSDFSGYTCTCPPYYVGVDCDTPYNPCNECDTCSNNGTCYSTYEVVSPGEYNYLTECNCTASFTGNRCQDDVDECSLFSPCLNNGATCINTFGGYLCICPPGFEGELCEIDIDDCSSDPCHNEGVCTDLVNGFECDCNNTEFTGHKCEIPLNQTCEYLDCYFNGVCEYNQSQRRPVCSCKTGYTGEFCSFVFQPCPNASCDPKGTQECIQNDFNITCDCRPGYSGDTCNISIYDSCQYNKCNNGGTCIDVHVLGGHYCECPDGFTGRYCEIGNRREDCLSGLECQNNGSCVRVLDEEFCRCPNGWGGIDCSYDIDECYQTPCANGGTCTNLEGGYECSCTSEFEGVNCELLKPNCSLCENGGSCDIFNGEAICSCPKGYEGKRCEKGECPYSNCTELANNGNCDIHCFNSACDYDGGKDPCYTRNGRDPWANCTMSEECRERFNNGYCDQLCNNALCLYDGQDCADPVPNECPANVTRYCQSLIENGECNTLCNTEQCPLDVADCDRQLYLPNYLVLIVQSLRSVDFEGEREKQFLSRLGALIHAVVEVVERKEIPLDQVIAEGYTMVETPSINRNTELFRYWRLVLRINLQFCTSSCPTTIDQVLNQIQAAYSSGEPTGDFHIVDAVSGDVPSDESTGSGLNTNYIIGSVVGVMVVIAMIAIVAFVLGKRVRSDGGVRESVRKVVRVRGMFRIPGGSTPEPSETNLMQRGQSTDRHSGSIDTFDDPSPSSVRKGASSLPHFTWNKMEAPIKSGSISGSSPGSDGTATTCLIGQRGRDERKWTYLHCEAARMSGDPRSLIGPGLSDINSQGPGGLTPLMVAIMSEDKFHRNKLRPGGSSVRSDSSSGSEYGEHDPMVVSQSPKFSRFFSTIIHSKPYESKVPCLIHAPSSDLNLFNDQGETALHLAVKHGREEHIHYLLMAKADPNKQDKWGKTPLHVAIGAVNDRAFQILIECASINLELKSNGGITPLMLAVKMGNNRVLQQLISKNADIIATDLEGRTAVHWAAMINNVDALKLLIKQGPDNVKDAPNQKGETALFLASREGCLGAVRHLLDCYANATIVDNLERSPLLIAYEKQNFDVMDMLQQSNQAPLGGPPAMYSAMKQATHSVPNSMFGSRNNSIKIESAHIPSVVPPTTTMSHAGYVYPNGHMPTDRMTHSSSIEAELERLVASTQYPDMGSYIPNALYTSQLHPAVTQTHILNTSPPISSGGGDRGHSPGQSIISPSGISASQSPGETSTEHNFSPSSSDVYHRTTPPSAQQVLGGSTPLQHLPSYVDNGVVHTTPPGSERQPNALESSVYPQSTVHNSSNNSPLMGQTVSPNPASITMAQATINGYAPPLQISDNSPSSHCGFPSPPKEAGEYSTYGTPYSGAEVSSMTPSPEDGSSHHGEGSPMSRQYTTIHGQYSYSTDPYQISLQPCNAAAGRTSHFPGISTGFNPKESTV